VSGNLQFEHAMRALAAKFAGELPHKLDDIHALYVAASRSDDPVALLQTLRRSLHSLAGAAMTFGHPHITDAARRFEQRVADLLVRESPSAGTITQLRSALDELLDSYFERVGATQDDSNPAEITESSTWPLFFRPPEPEDFSGNWP